MKVLHLIDSGGLYGAEKMLLTLVKEQTMQGLNPMILSAGETGIEEKALEAEARRLCLPVTAWRMQSGINFREALAISRWARKERFDILHSHGYKFNILMGFMPKLIRGIPLVSTVHGYTVKPGFTRLGIYLYIDRIARRFHDAVVYVSNVMGNGSSRLREGGAVNVIPNGISTDDNEQATTLSIEDVTDKPFILFVGRLSKEKGTEILIKSLVEIRKKVDIDLVVVGEGSEQQALEYLTVQLELEEVVHFAGYQNDVASFMRAATALVIPSRMEGLPITLLEGMKNKVPIIATRVGGMVSALGDGKWGRLLIPEDPEALSSGVLEVISDTNYRQRIVSDAYSAFLENYSASRMAQRYQAVYDGV